MTDRIVIANEVKQSKTPAAMDRHATLAMTIDSQDHPDATCVALEILATSVR
jgi:hypothetical protein